MKSKTLYSSGAVLLSAGLLTFLGGCAATQVALEHKDLDVQTKMSATVFLDVEKREKTVFLDIKNTSDKDMDLRPLIKSRLEKNGYIFAPTAKEAFYIIPETSHSRRVDGVSL